MNDKKVILITGASSGLGKAAAKKLIEEGHIVYGAARRLEKMSDLIAMGGYAIAIDVTEEEALIKAVQEILNNHGRIDVLINNAGFGLYGSVEDTSLKDAKYQFDVNLFGLARLTQLVTPHMRKQKSGRIINISSMGGKIYSPLGAWYHATKHALEGFSDCLRLELKPFGIDVVVIEPGIIQSSFGDVLISPLLERSKGGNYESLASNIVRTTKHIYENGHVSKASVISNVISKAIRVKNPKTRYAAGKYSFLGIFIRKWFGDKIFDKIVMFQLKEKD